MSDNIKGPIYRHKIRENKWQAPTNVGRNLEEIEAHVEEHVGKIETVLHEAISDVIHLDILFVPATANRPYHTLITSGVSDLPMNVPDTVKRFNRVELVISLPANWPITQDAFQDENNYWPVRWLKLIGRFPHEYNTWVGWGHTIPYGDPAMPIANTNFIGVMLGSPYWLDGQFFQLQASNNDIITFYNLIPLYQEEMDFKLKYGADVLEKELGQQAIKFVVDVNRPSAIKGKGYHY